MTKYFAGIDIGSTMTKVVIISDEIIASITGPTGPEHRHLANQVMDMALKKADIPFDAITYIVSTGYGRINVPFADRQITEITCHAKGVSWLFPQAKAIIDIGGQDSKVITIENGKPTNFIMNDKCAAGSGRFLEIIADTLQISISDMGPLSIESKNPVSISNICTVYAEQEVASRLVDGLPIADIIAGIHESLAGRIIRMVNRLNIKPPIVMTGGGAKNIGLIKAFSEKIGQTMLIPKDPLITGALGAAIIGREAFRKSIEKGTPLETKERVLEKRSITINNSLDL